MQVNISKTKNIPLNRGRFLGGCLHIEFAVPPQAGENSSLPRLFSR